MLCCSGHYRIKLKVDDSLDVFAVHGVGGILGTILCGLLISSSWGGVGFDEVLLQLITLKYSPMLFL